MKRKNSAARILIIGGAAFWTEKDNALRQEPEEDSERARSRIFEGGISKYRLKARAKETPERYPHIVPMREISSVVPSSSFCASVIRMVST